LKNARLVFLEDHLGVCTGERVRVFVFKAGGVFNPPAPTTQRPPADRPCSREQGGCGPAAQWGGRGVRLAPDQPSFVQGPGNGDSFLLCFLKRERAAAPKVGGGPKEPKQEHVVKDPT